MAGRKPLTWADNYDSYCVLSAAQRGFLENPFAKFGATSSPEAAQRSFRQRTGRALFQFFHRVPLESAAVPGDLLLVPEIFEDGRVAWFQERFPGLAARKVALFHDALTWSLPEYAPANPTHRFTTYLAALARFELVVCISRESEEDLLRFWREQGTLPAPTRVRHLPVSFSGERPPATPNFAARRLLLVATLEPRKNHLRLLEACQRLWANGETFSLQLIGRQAPQGGQAVQERIEVLQKAGHPLQWERHVDDAALRRAYEACSFTVYPSIREGFGLPILESLWHGRPCLTGGNGALGEVAAGGGCLTVDQNDPAALAEGIRRLLREEDLYARLYREAAERKFLRWPEYAASLFALIQEFPPAAGTR